MVSVKLVLSLICAYFECMLFSVLHLGWPSLVYVYKSTRLFTRWCPPESEFDRNVTTTATSLLECELGDRYFNLIFNIGVALQMHSYFPIGVFFDRFGILKTRILAL